jgi:hypothetical protein
VNMTLDGLSIIPNGARAPPLDPLAFHGLPAEYTPTLKPPP